MEGGAEGRGTQMFSLLRDNYMGDLPAEPSATENLRTQQRQLQQQAPQQNISIYMEHYSSNSHNMTSKAHSRAALDTSTTENLRTQQRQLQQQARQQNIFYMEHYSNKAHSRAGKAHSMATYQLRANCAHSTIPLLSILGCLGPIAGFRPKGFLVEAPGEPIARTQVET